MLRSMFQVYVNGSGKAFEFYKKAFGGEVVYQPSNDNNVSIENIKYDHSELNIYGQILAVSEAIMSDYPNYENETPLIHRNNGKRLAITVERSKTLSDMLFLEVNRWNFRIKSMLSVKCKNTSTSTLMKKSYWMI